MVYIKGNFKKYIFHSNNGYTVGLFHVKESNVKIDTKTILLQVFFQNLMNLIFINLKVNLLLMISTENNLMLLIMK